jgi:hypothetical protein
MCKIAGRGYECVGLDTSANSSGALAFAVDDLIPAT